MDAIKKIKDSSKRPDGEPILKMLTQNSTTNDTLQDVQNKTCSTSKIENKQTKTKYNLENTRLQQKSLKRGIPNSQ